MLSLMEMKDGLNRSDLKTERIFIRCRPWELEAFKAAAKRVRKNQTSFVYDTVMREVREVLTPEVFRKYEMRILQ